MSFPNVSDIITTTLEARSGKIADNVTKNNALLSKLKMKDNIRPVDGGRLIYEELAFAENANGGWYSGYDTLPVAAQDVLTSAEFNWKQYAVPVAISGLEEAMNSGKAESINLLESRLKVAESTMANNISQGLYSDGTGSGGKIITGLDAAVPVDPTTGTYGGINRATWTFWRSYVNTGTTLSATNIDGVMNTTWANLVRGSDKPDLIVCDTVFWGLYMASLQPLQRFTDSSMADLGFDNVKFMSAPVVLDGGIGGYATTKTAYFLNTNYIHFRPHSRRNMVPLGGERVAVNQDATVKILGWMGNLTCSGAQFQGRVIGS